MKFSVLCGELLKSLTKVGSVIPIKTTTPILESYLLNFKNDDLTITATDLDISISSNLKVKGSGDGSIVVPSKKFFDTVKSLPINIELNIDINTTENKILINTDFGEYRLTGQPTSDYPKLYSLENSEKVFIDSLLLKKMIDKTLFATSSDEIRPAMTGVLLHLLKGEVRAVSTDGHRLVKFVKKEAGFNQEKEIVLPKKTLNIISKYLDESLKFIIVNTTHASFVFENTTLLTKLIDEKFPNYENVIPTDNKFVLSVAKNDLLSTVKRIHIYSNSITHMTKFSIENNKLTISAEDSEFGVSAVESLPCEFNDKEKFEIGFNALYIMEILNHIDDEEVNFLLSTPTRAAMVVPREKTENEELVMLVMPLRVN